MIDLILEDAEERMEKSIDAFKNELSTIRTGRANPNMLDRINVDYWGSPTPLNQIAGVSVVEGRQLVVKPYDKTALKNIERAIFEANLGLTPQNDGQLIRIVVPPLTEERRKEFVKLVWKYAESAKVAIRNIRRSANDDIKHAGVSEDEEKYAQEDVQDLTNKYIKKIDELGKAKEKELMTV